MNVPDQRYCRNVSCALNLISHFYLFISLDASYGCGCFIPQQRKKSPISLDFLEELELE